MCQHEGMALAPWASLGGGNFKTEEQRKSTEGRQMGGASEADLKVSVVLEKIAKQKKTIMTSVALAYVVHKSPYVFPIVGGRKIEHLKGNIEALKLKLTKEEIAEIEDAAPFDVGFPMNFYFRTEPKYHSDLDAQDIFLIKANGRIDMPPKASVSLQPGHT